MSSLRAKGIPWRSVAVYTALVVIGVLAASPKLFTTWVPYDDEGTMLLSLKGFVDGHVLYRDIYSQYGPFYFELFGGAFAALGRPVTTDTGRLIVIALWVSTSLVLGIAVQRLTGRLLLGAATFGGSWVVLRALTAEPMHPVGLCLLLLALLVLVLCSRPFARPRASGAATGLLLAALVMTKVNIGVLAIAALLFAAAMVLPPLATMPWLRRAAAASLVAVPWVLMAPDLGELWVVDLAVLLSLAGAAIAAAAYPVDPVHDGETDASGRRWLAWSAGALVGGAVVMLLAILPTGPSLGDVADGVIGEAVRLRDVFVVPFGLPGAAATWGAAALAGSWVLTRRAASAPSASDGVLRLAAGVVILVTATELPPFSIGPDTLPPVVPLVLAWIVVLPLPGRARDTNERFARVALAALAVLEVLQAYPVAGTQARVAALLFVPLGALAVGDGLTALRTLELHRPRAADPRVVATAIAAVVAAHLVWTGVARPGLDDRRIAAANTALPFAEANRVRLDAATGGTLTQVIQILRDQGCTAFIGYPSMNSFYLWSHIDPPRRTVPGFWMRLLDDEQQQRVVDELERAERPCVVRNDGLAKLWLGDSPPPDRPLVRYVDRGFTPVASADAYVVSVRR